MKCIVLLYIPTVVLAGVYETTLALSYAIVTHWFQGEIESINEKNMKIIHMIRIQLVGRWITFPSTHGAGKGMAIEREKHSLR